MMSENTEKWKWKKILNTMENTSFYEKLWIGYFQYFDSSSINYTYV